MNISFEFEVFSHIKGGSRIAMLAPIYLKRVHVR